MSMILEGIVTTLGPDAGLNMAPMGPEAEPAMTRLVLKPFRSATTYANLKRHGEGVFHVTDDAWLLARAAVGCVEPEPATLPAVAVRGRVLTDCCRWYEFRVTSLDDRSERARIECQVVHAGRVRDFFGFNRAKHAIVEAAILATRTEILPITEILGEFERLAAPVRKTGGDAEQRAYQFLLDYVRAQAARRGGPEAKR